SSRTSLVIACGALAHEITTLLESNSWPHLKVECLPASLHNRPEQIAPAVRKKIKESRATFDSIFVAYADCGTGGHLDKVLAEEGVERLPGAHCYEFFSGSEAFLARHENEPGVFYLTDFLARHFERLVMEELGIRAHPELKEMYFSHYTKLVYLSQSDLPDVLAMARSAADTLGLEFEHVRTGFGELEAGLAAFARVSIPEN
ncbi:MAG: DUF1638 domain-containing protein, partial [Pseudomonadota bacterium]|nr:DUF1638 domain-containing protein [Pseudomonadota bacterium]